ncbi:heme biosynthesis HemY N-terminal domain-containing protein [Pleionea mediterranea]|uniref:HemY protein n=1 Tax=Pleionea mediterranea TaxID=523701 RepID=A0A316FXD5_9GAMM|nr:heme biosynthesis HemY N-terminal domain-containing protein [Pleionea mediterranea]PWK52785.1 HemY protein [Pleionea mediterranea]
MKLRHLALLAIIIGALLAWFIKDQRGFVLIAWDNHSLEMRLWIAAVLALGLIFVTFISSWLVLTVKRTGKFVSLWSKNRGSRRSRNQTLNGLIALTEGHWEKAEHLFIKASEKSDSRLINYLLAAKSAQEQKDYTRRDNYLQKAAEYQPNASIAVSLTQAELQYESGQYELALASLSQLWDQRKKHPYVLKLLAKCYYRLKDWQRLFDLLPALKQKQALERSQFESIEMECVTKLLISQANKGCEQLQHCWQKMSGDYQKNPQLVICFSRLLIELGAFTEAEAVLRSALKKGYKSQLIYWYGKAAGRDNQTQLSFAESFRQDGQSDWEMFYALGQLSFNNELWGRARDYLLQSLQLKNTLEASQLLIMTYEQLDEPVTTITRTLKKALASAANASSPSLIDKSTSHFIEQ